MAQVDSHWKVWSSLLIDSITSCGQTVVGAKT